MSRANPQPVAKTSRDGSRSATNMGQARSRKTNGATLFLTKTDGRSAPARRIRDLELEYASQLPAPISTAQHATISLAAALQVQLELVQAMLARGEPIDGHELVRLSRALRAALSDLGLNTKPEPPKPPSLAQVLAEGRA